jgi:site-specific recombinase XerD
MSQKLGSKKKIGIYDYDYLLNHTFSLIKKELSENNVKLIEKYDLSMVNSSLSKATRQKNLKMILSLSRLLQKDWKNTTRDDIERLVSKVMNQYSDHNGQETNTSHDHKKTLKIFFRWIKLGSREKTQVGDPPETKDVKLRKVKDKIVREHLLTEEDRTKLLHACGENARDRAFIDCHFEAGTRPGEILNLQIRHVKFDEYGAVLHVDGKTGARPIRLVKSTPSLAAWLSVHPAKDDSSAPLWPNVSYKRTGEALSYAGARQMLNRRCKMANLSKRVNLNLFRHSEATTTANFMTEAQMRKRHGWATNSQMPARYVHLVNADVDAAIFEHLGIEKKKNEEKNLPKKCHICEMPNDPDSKICSKCGKPLALDVAIDMEEKEKEEKQSLLRRIEDLEAKNKTYNDIEPDLKKLALQVFEDLFDKIEFTKVKRK